MSQIFTILKKELRDTVRDRRTLLSMIILPMVLMPLMIIGMGKFVEFQVNKSKEETSKIAIQGEAEEFIKLIKENEKIEILDIKGDFNETVRNGEINAGVIIPDNFDEIVVEQKEANIKLIIKSTSDRSSTAVSRIKGVVREYNEKVLEKRFVDQGVDPKVLSKVYVFSEDVVTEKELGGFGLGFLLPLFIVMWSILGGQYTAIDASAGEKERKTLEALLLTPVKRFHIVFGKFLAVATVALISIVVALSSLYGTLQYVGSSMKTMQTGSTPLTGITNFSLEIPAVLLMLFVSILLALMFSAVILSIAIFAKNYKEAQSYIGPSYIVVILPVVLINIIPNLKPALWFFAFPAVNAVLLFKEILIGQYILSHILVTVFSLIAFGLIAIYLASKIYSKEKVLFG